jgi:methanogenic corrinoid protein MtbC1
LPDVASPALPPEPFDHRLVHAFVEAVLAEDDQDCLRFVGELRRGGRTVESIYLDLLAPAARELGDRWVDDTCSFVEVTVALGRLQMVLRDLSSMFVREHPERALVGRALLSCVPGEQHSLGLFMVAEFFIRDGWGVRVGPPVSEADLLSDVRSSWYDVVGFSLSCNSRLTHLKREIVRVRQVSMNPRLLVLVGGRVFNERPELVLRVGADASAMNAELAPERARQLLTAT